MARYLMTWRSNGEPRCDLTPTCRSYAADGSGTTSHTPDTVDISGVVTAPVQIDVAAAARTFTRASGSYLTDGFAVGMGVEYTGFGSNNVKKIVEAVTALVLTVTDGTGLADETGSGNEVAQALIPGAYAIDATFADHVLAAWDAGEPLVGDLRIKEAEYGPSVPERDEGVLPAIRDADPGSFADPTNLGGWLRALTESGLMPSDTDGRAWYDTATGATSKFYASSDMPPVSFSARYASRPAILVSAAAGGLPVRIVEVLNDGADYFSILTLSGGAVGVASGDRLIVLGHNAGQDAAERLDPLFLSAVEVADAVWDGTMSSRARSSSSIAGVLWAVLSAVADPTDDVIAWHDATAPDAAGGEFYYSAGSGPVIGKSAEYVDREAVLWDTVGGNGEIHTRVRITEIATDGTGIHFVLEDLTTGAPATVSAGDRLIVLRKKETAREIWRAALALHATEVGSAARHLLVDGAKLNVRQDHTVTTYTPIVRASDGVEVNVMSTTEIAFFDDAAETTEIARVQLTATYDAEARRIGFLSVEI